MIANYRNESAKEERQIEAVCFEHVQFAKESKLWSCF
jgi:hypothetical protein